MAVRSLSRRSLLSLAGLAALVGACNETRPLAAPEAAPAVAAADEGPTVVDPNLTVRTVVSGLVTPVAMAFLGPHDFLVTEKNTGRVRRVVDGAAQGTVLDLPVNFASERGLLGIALDPQFPADPGVYLYWTESTTGADDGTLANVPLLGNRVDRFVWNGATLAYDRTLVRLHAFQADAGQPLRGNHNGGVLTFGPDGKLYVFIGDNGRRGNLQNLRCGPTTFYDCPPATPVPDDQFGGPTPDAAHLTGVVLRLNEDGSAPADNPFFAVGAAMGGDAGTVVQKIFAYGHRNGIGMAFDPEAPNLWLAENGDDSFSELNRVERASNGGWVQIMGPASRVAEFKAIETSAQFFGLQQIRWLPTNIASTPEEALARLYVLPGSRYTDPEFSWKYEVAPAGLGFVRGRALGPQYEGDMITGAARQTLLNGQLFHFDLTGNRRRIAVDDPRLEDRVADNLGKYDVTESESLVFGSGFGIVTDIRTGPSGNLYVVSNTLGSVYEIARRR